MDGSKYHLEVDSAVTCKEMCLEIKEKVGLEDEFGFSIWIASLEQVRWKSSTFRLLSENVFDDFRSFLKAFGNISKAVTSFQKTFSSISEKL